MKPIRTLLASALVAAGLAASPANAEDVRIALVVKALGIGFFEAAAKGAEEAAAELGGVEIIYTGPTEYHSRRADRGHQLADRAESRCHRGVGE